MKKCNRHAWLIGLMALALISGSCQLKQGRLYFDKIGLDPITVYKMAPLERTIYCLSEIKDEAGLAFAIMHETALKDVQLHPQQADWSELICLSLSGEADRDQLRQTVETLDFVISIQQQPSNPLQAFRRLIQTRLDLYGQIENKDERIDALEREYAEQVAAAEQSASDAQQIRRAQREKIIQLEQQVQKLKEVELLLPPKQ